MEGVFAMELPIQNCIHVLIMLVMRFDPGNAHAWGLSIRGMYVGSGEVDNNEIETRVHKSLPRFGPRRVTTYIPLIWLYCYGVLQWGVYNGGVDWI
jgi:hypothetical protein